MCKKWAALGKCDDSEDAYVKENCQLTCGVCHNFEDPWSIGYKRSFDYVPIVEKTRKGIWSVPFTFGVTLISKSVFTLVNAAMVQGFDEVIPSAWGSSTTFAHSMRKAGLHLYLSNLVEYGHLIDFSDYPVHARHPDLYMIDNNPIEFQEVYIHPDYNTWRELGMGVDPRDGHVRMIIIALVECSHTDF